jgi:hypothetical protein
MPARAVRDIEELTGVASLEPYLTTAREILARRAAEFSCITAALRRNLETMEDRTLERLVNNDIGTLLLDEAQLVECLNTIPAAAACR